MADSASPNDKLSNTPLGASPTSQEPVTKDGQKFETASWAGPLPDSEGVDFSSLLAPPQSDGELGRLGHFRILKKLGAGGMGMVLLAEDINLQRPVALKIMLPKYARSQQARERFLREARAAAKIQHEHVVTIHHVGQDREIPFFAMEFLKGTALDSYLDERKEISLAAAIRIGREVAEGLQAAHAQGLIHRDIKPANIWLEAPKGRVKILDFGLARDSSDEIKLTHAGTVIGTPAYMSPEQAAGERVDQRTDLFSLGIVLFELVTGQLPFKGLSTVATMYAIRYEPHDSVASLNPKSPTGLVKLIDQLLKKKPDARPPSAADVVQSLNELEGTTPSSESRAEPLPPPALNDHTTRLRDTSRSNKSTKRPRWLVPAGVAAVTGFVLLAFTLISGQKPKPNDPKQDDPNVVKKDEPSPLPISDGIEITFDLGNGIKLEVIKIPAKGKKFTMGSPATEEGHIDNEQQHEVTFGHDFHMGKYEVTQEQYQAIMGNNPSGFIAAKHPANTVSWIDAQEFMKKINDRFKDRKVRFRLPSEAEWEYACRAGTQTPYQYGKTLTTQQARFNIATGPSPVGSFEANAIGLYDMHGNVTEWCEDFFGPYTVAPKDGTAQKVKTAEEFRVLRGGNWGDMVLACRSAYRIYHLPDFRTTNIHGFRVALDQDEPIEVKKADAAPPTVVKGDEMSYDLGNGVKLEIVKINAKGKKFLMGSPEEEPDRNPDENKFDAEEQHEVTFGHDFHIGKYEVTQSQYQAIMGHNPSTSANNPLHPVDSVSWNDVQDFLKKLNEKFKERKIDFRLPTEAEWEYACRAGTTTPYYFGKTLTKAQANFDESSTKPVGTFEANAFGLYDMHGNVCEWCADWFGPYSDAPKDGTAQSSKQAGDLRVLRGGLWSYIPNRCRSAYRGYIAPDDRKLSVIGFRVVVTTSEDAKKAEPLP